MKRPMTARQAALALLGVFVALLVAVHGMPVASGLPERMHAVSVTAVCGEGPERSPKTYALPRLGQDVCSDTSSTFTRSRAASD
jgi:hypothetical protein